MILQTTCRECGVTALWEAKPTAMQRLVNGLPRGRQETFEVVGFTVLDHTSSFVCEDWRDHQEAVIRAEESGRPEWIGFVLAEPLAVAA
uniref:Uncharacterized protein n=1 Tax=uncultured prokaryote TaxID=198431 RepID=A0A0H5Q4S2_9ZZZZ|nr:hypothetical protein [uncultured prokaryote]